MSPRPCSINYVPKRNKFCVSYGLVVFTKYPTKRVVILERQVPYCLQDNLWKNVMNRSFYKKSFSTETDEKKNIVRKSIPSIVRYIRKYIKTYKQEDLNLNEPFEIEDYGKYKIGKVFEDKFDFPHGQMTRKTKSYVYSRLNFLRKQRMKNENENDKNNNNNDNNENENNNDSSNFNYDDDDDIYYEEKERLVKKFAGFITAFTEFEEETGYTFKFDSDMVKKDVKEMVVKFKGLDDYIYEQHFFLVTVDKLEKWKLDEQSKKIFHEVVSHEVDRQIYKTKCVDVEEAKKLFLFQQRDNGKVDLKHMLLCCFDDNDNNDDNDDDSRFDVEMMTTTTTDEKENNSDIEDEEMFMYMLRHIAPKVYIKSFRRRRWRDF